MAAACGSSDTAITAPEPLTDPRTGEGSGSDTADTTSTVLGPATDAGDDPAAAAENTTTTVLEPVVDRLPADPAAPADEWVAGINTAGWDFHRLLEGNAVSSPISIGTAFSLARAGASADTAEALDEIFGFPQAGLHSAANAVDLTLAEASASPTTLEVANRLLSLRVNVGRWVVEGP